MPAASRPPTYDTTFDAAPGEAVAVAPGVVRITAPNAGPFTFRGTNTFVLGGERVAIVDPGPDERAHREALLVHIGGRPVEAILLTHTHRDHSDLARGLAAAVKAPLWFGGRHRRSRERKLFEIDVAGRESDFDLVPDRVLHDGETVSIAGVAIAVIATPGHCANHLCFGLAGAPFLLSGDHVMGWNSTMIAVPDGSMADYLQSLRKIIELPYATYLPAHGGPIPDGPDYARRLLLHRELRNQEIVQAVERGARTIGDLLQAIYPALKPALLPAARMTLTAHVEYLSDTGRIHARRTLAGIRVGPLQRPAT